MNAVNDGIGPPAPILGGPQAVLVPSGSFEQRAAAGERRQAELAVPGNQVAVQMLGMNCAERAPFLQRRRIGSDAEAQKARLVPKLNGLDEGAGRKFAVSDCAGTRAVDARADGISEAGVEIPLARRW